MFIHKKLRLNRFLRLFLFLSLIFLTLLGLSGPLAPSIVRTFNAIAECLNRIVIRTHFRLFVCGCVRVSEYFIHRHHQHNKYGQMTTP